MIPLGDLPKALNFLSMPRLDRLITLYLCSPFTRIFAKSRVTTVPILAYHSISDNLFGYSHPYYQINTSPKVFAEQMKWLRNEGYRTLDLADLPAALASGADLSKCCVITFDDGYRDFLTEGWPVMHQCGFTATVFLTTDRIHQTSKQFEGADYLTWQDVRELHAQGISFGSHTVSHPDLRSMEPAAIDFELGYSKEIIEQQLGVPVSSFAYPFPFPVEDANFTRYLADSLENHGFQLGVSTIIGRASGKSSRFFLPRLPMNSWDDRELLEAKMCGGYDWMHILQRIYKTIHHNVTLMQRSSVEPIRNAGK
jgi:peptidoglycan/xylan/chitin deacetylase (PgdA/CDA1 family)